MSLTIDGRTALVAMLDANMVFSGIAARDWSSAALKLAKRQINAGRQTRDDILAIRGVLGADVFEKALDGLSAHHMKLLAKRVDPSVDPETIKTSAMALMHIRSVLQADWQPAVTDPTPTPVSTPSDPPAKSNPYIGRKAFRTGR